MLPLSPKGVWGIQMCKASLSRDGLLCAHLLALHCCRCQPPFSSVPSHALYIWEQRQKIVTSPLAFLVLSVPFLCFLVPERDLHAFAHYLALGPPSHVPRPRQEQEWFSICGVQLSGF